MRIRSAEPDDAELILSLLRELAAYEKQLGKFHTSAEVIRRDFFGAAAFCHCELAIEGDEPVGIATWTWTYRSFGPDLGLYLEDLFVRDQFRKRGIGKALLAHLAKKALRSGCTRMEWQVMDWNKASIDFYESLGARSIPEWLTYRLDGSALKKMAG